MLDIPVSCPLCGADAELGVELPAFGDAAYAHLAFQACECRIESERVQEMLSELDLREEAESVRGGLI